MIFGKDNRRACGMEDTLGSQELGFCSASSGNQMRAASIVPSFNGINMFSMTRTALGKFVTITTAL
jgi:hypothetical protein